MGGSYIIFITNSECILEMHAFNPTLMVYVLWEIHSIHITPGVGVECSVQRFIFVTQYSL